MQRVCVEYKCFVTCTATASIENLVFFIWTLVCTYLTGLGKLLNRFKIQYSVLLSILSCKLTKNGKVTLSCVVTHVIVSMPDCLSQSNPIRPIAQYIFHALLEL